MMEEISHKVLSYEKFINDVLKKDLLAASKNLDAIHAEMIEFINLKTFIEKIVDEGLSNDLETKMDMGCNFYMDAVIPDTSMICVKIGLGNYLEMTLPEASDFAEEKVVELEKAASMLEQKAVKIQAHIRIALEGLAELQGITFSSQKEKQIIDF